MTEVRLSSLSESESWFRSMIVDMAKGVLVFDALGAGDSRISFANHAAETIFARPAEDLVGRQFDDLVYPDEWPKLAERKRIAARGGNLAGVVNYRARRPDGTPFWIEATSVTSRSPAQGHVLRTITLVRDITETHEREIALADARARIDRILNVVPGIFYVLSAVPGEKHRTSFVSASVANVFGFTPEEASQPGFLSELAEVDLAAARYAALQEAGPNGIGVADYPARLRGRRIWLRDTLRLIELPDGRTDIVGFIADATAEHVAAEARQAAEAALQRRNWALSAYSRSLSILVRSGPLQDVMNRICESVAEEPIYCLA